MTGDHFQMGDHRPLLDIVRRDEQSWEPMIPSRSKAWETFCRGFTKVVSVRTTQSQLESQLQLLLDRLRQISEPPQDQYLMAIKKITSKDWTWEQNVALVCYSCGISTPVSRPSELWNGNLELLAKFLRSSPTFSGDVTSETLGTIRHLLRSAFDFNENEQDGSLKVNRCGLTGSKRPSHEELNPAKRTKNASGISTS